MAQIHLWSCCKNFCVCIRHLGDQHIQEDDHHHEEEGQVKDDAQGPEVKQSMNSKLIASHNILRHVYMACIKSIFYALCPSVIFNMTLCNPLPETSTILKICENTAWLHKGPQSSVEDFMEEHSISVKTPLVRVDPSTTHQSTIIIKKDSRCIIS